MEKYIDDLLTEDLLLEAGQTAGLTSLGESLGDFENFVFRAENKQGPCILRITHSSHRSLEEVESELKFIQAVSKSGVKMACPVNDLGPQKLEASDGSCFIATAFELMPGSRIPKEEINLNNFELLGETTARIHQVVRDLTPHQFHRKSWDEEQTADFTRFFPNERQDLKLKASEIFDRLQSYPKSSDNYALIHADLHMGNFHLHEGELHIFDFDDSCFHWLAADPAISLFYWISHGTKPGERRKEASESLMKAYWNGYGKVAEPLKEFDDLYRDILLFRNVQLVNVLNQKFEGKEMPDNEAKVLVKLEQRILEDRCAVDD